MKAKKIILSLFAIPLLFIQCGQPHQKNELSQPNILWITIEDTSPQFIGCYGNKTAQTPAIDKLAEEGVRFTNAFSTGTVCSPSRTAIITGVKTYKTGTGNHRSKYPIPGFIKGFPYYLQQQGYYTSNNVKTDYNVAQEKAFIAEAWDESSNKAGWWNRNPGQPFFAVFNYVDSHQSRTMTETYDWYKKNVLEQLAPEERIGENEFEMPPFYLDSPEMRKQFARVYNSIKLTDNKIGELLARLEADNLKDSTIIFFYADHGEGMPRGKTNGINYGYRVPFIVWFPEMYKHLSPWGTAGVATDELIDFTDLAPTLISIAGGEIPEHLEGRPFLGEKREKPVSHLNLSSDRSDNGIDMVRTVTDGRFVYSRNFMPYINEARYIRYMEIGEIKQQMRKDLAENKLNPLQKSLFEPRPAEFLFDIENDLWETQNLANNPEFKPVLEKMRELLKKEVIASRDVMFLPEYEVNLLSDTTTAYEFRMNEKNYPVEKIYEAASLAGFRGTEIAKKQVDLLTNPNPVIRYWSVLGLRSQSAETLMPFSANILSAMDDNYLPVAVIASAIAHEMFGNKKAEINLKKFCASKNPDVSLMAVYALLYIQNKEPFVETIWKVREMDDRNYNIRAACMDFLGSLEIVPNNPDYRE
ncbi:Arylsulfatase A [Mariniphaga anaerophila]|uniref:Arylsulfatase A n=1 Tax=Mariniphaga anaerophila TaxID=1484053 RepID=A0A1M5CI13_9BACT|nr:sulfatase [Mariniphaga anaerophila]SHF54415.1 Arylsulfatase A [Mariniphaga anaerophila]